MRFSCIANYDFARWEEVFKDLMLTGAIVERLAHRAHIMDMSGEKAIGWKNLYAILREGSNMNLISGYANKDLIIDEFEVHMLTRGYITSLCECIMHNMAYDKVSHYIKMMVSFNYYGWKGIMNI